MSTNHKPAYPLPWGVGDSGMVHDAEAAEVCAPMGIERADMLDVAAYIVHAANAYPRLVAEVREMLKNATYSDGIAQCLTHDCEALESLLSELGEAQS